MNTEPNTPPPNRNLPQAVVEQARGLPLVWLIPLVAALAGAWLAWKTISEKGPAITISFHEAYGLEAGKTKIKFKDIEVGLVEAVRLKDDLTGVVVTARMQPGIADHLRQGTSFWVVKPQFGLGGVSGLDTLLAGNYIAVEFGPGKPTRRFTGLEHAPKISAETPGRAFVLLTDSASAVQEGTPVYFRNIQAGRVVDIALTEDKQNVRCEIFIDAPFDQLVQDNSRFWLTSAIDLSLNTQGFNLKIGSLLSMFTGGIAFDTPNLNVKGELESAAGKEFWLHKDFASVDEHRHVHKRRFVLYFNDSVRGLSAGAPVEIRGIKVGAVSEVRLDFDFGTKTIRIPVVIEIDPDTFIDPALLEKHFQAEQATAESGRRPVFEKLVERGLRARLKTGSLLTGQLFVDLDFYPESPPRQVVYGGPYPELPTLPSVTDQLQKDVTEIIARIKALPLDKIGEELLGTARGANRLANSADLQKALAGLDGLLGDVRRLAQTTDGRIAALATSMETSLGTARLVLQQLEPGSPMAVNLNKAMEELSAAARSIRTLGDYLNRHPDALLKGKSGSGGKP